MPATRSTPTSRSAAMAGGRSPRPLPACALRTCPTAHWPPLLTMLAAAPAGTAAGQARRRCCRCCCSACQPHPHPHPHPHLNPNPNPNPNPHPHPHPNPNQVGASLGASAATPQALVASFRGYEGAVRVRARVRVRVRMSPNPNPNPNQVRGRGDRAARSAAAGRRIRRRAAVAARADGRERALRPAAACGHLRHLLAQRVLVIYYCILVCVMLPIPSWNSTVVIHLKLKPTWEPSWFMLVGP